MIFACLLTAVRSKGVRLRQNGTSGNNHEVSTANPVTMENSSDSAEHEASKKRPREEEGESADGASAAARPAKQQMVRVLESGEHCPHHLRGQRPL